MRIIILGILLCFSVFASAGQMSQIDQVVRETVIVNFDVEWEEIWGLQFAPNEEPCLVVVTGFTKTKTTDEGEALQFHVCVTRDVYGSYNGELLRSSPHAN